MDILEFDNIFNVIYCGQSFTLKSINCIVKIVLIVFDNYREMKRKHFFPF